MPHEQTQDELKETVQQLRQEIETYRVLVENSQDLLYRTDLEGRITYISPSVYRLSGYSVAEALGMKMAEQVYLVPAERQKFLEHLRQRGQVFNFEARLKRKDGSVWWASTNAHFLLDASGAIIGVEGITRDITELKQTESALREREELFRLAFHTSPDSINLNRAADGLYIDINEGFTKIMGYTREDAIGKTSVSMDIWHNPADRTRLVDALRRDGYVENLEARFVAKDGTVRDGLMSARILDIRGEAVILSITRDISDRKAAERSLKESEEKYRALIENANDAIFVAQDGFIRFANRKTEEITGYQYEALKEIPFVQFIHPADRDMVLERHQRRLAGEDLPTNYSFRIMPQSGGEMWVQINTVRILWEGQAASLNFLRDITYNRKLEIQLQQAQKMEALGTLAGGIAHDFNNILMGIQGRASILGLEMGTAHSSIEHITAIETYVQSAAALTRQLLGLARGGKYDVRPTDLNELVQTTAAMFGRTRKSIRIRTETPAAALIAEVDKQQIEQLLLNILINAWQAMPTGGEIRIEASAVRLDAASCKAYHLKPGHYARISLSDTGTGMDSATLQRIFDPFFTTKEKGRGTGLGLASAFGIAKNHGGTITAYSEPGHGATFNLYLPVSERKIEPETKMEAGLLKGSESILLVDDEEMIIDVGSTMLARLGYAVLTAKGGRAAIDLVRRKGDAIDLVILDMIMPGLDGGEVFDRIRESRPGLPVILSSGFAMGSHATAILNRGCNGFIQKPFNLSTLSKKIREVLEDPP